MGAVQESQTTSDPLLRPSPSAGISPSLLSMVIAEAAAAGESSGGSNGPAASALYDAGPQREACADSGGGGISALDKTGQDGLSSTAGLNGR